MIIEEKEITDQNEEPLIYTVADLADAVAEAIAKEREACAQICGEVASQLDWLTALRCADVIRARGGE